MTSAQRTHLRERRVTLTDETGFTLVELLVVVLILAVLVGLAVPAYLNFQGKAQSTAASADVRQVISDANAYYVTRQQLHRHDSRIAAVDVRLRARDLEQRLDGHRVAKSVGSGQTYCISALSGGHWAHYSGPGGTVVADPSTVTANPCT